MCSELPSHSFPLGADFGEQNREASPYPSTPGFLLFGTVSACSHWQALSCSGLSRLSFSQPAFVGRSPSLPSPARYVAASRLPAPARLVEHLSPTPRDGICTRFVAYGQCSRLPPRKHWFFSVAPFPGNSITVNRISVKTVCRSDWVEQRDWSRFHQHGPRGGNQRQAAGGSLGLCWYVREAHGSKGW